MIANYLVRLNAGKERACLVSLPNTVWPCSARISKQVAHLDVKQTSLRDSAGKNQLAGAREQNRLPAKQGKGWQAFPENQAAPKF